MEPTDREAAALVAFLKDVVEDAELCAAGEIYDVYGMGSPPARLTSGAGGIILNRPQPVLVVAVALLPVPVLAAVALRLCRTRQARLAHILRIQRDTQPRLRRCCQT